MGGRDSSGQKQSPGGAWSVLSQIEVKGAGREAGRGAGK